MRWCVSIGGVLVAGALAGGEVATLAAPGAPGARSADEARVDVELVLAVDVSYSMDMEELALQREGYALAITSKEFLQALKTGPTARWRSPISSGRRHPTRNRGAVARDRRPGVGRIGGRGDPEGAAAPRLAHLDLGRDQLRMPLFEANAYRGLRRVIDISGDGANHNGEPVTVARDAALARGITINGLPIMAKETNYATMDIENLDIYYEDCVIGGAGSFVVPIKTRDKFKEAIRTKLVMEVAHRVAEPRAVPAAAREPRVSCLIGERIWQERWGR